MIFVKAQNHRSQYNQLSTGFIYIDSPLSGEKYATKPITSNTKCETKNIFQQQFKINHLHSINSSVALNPQKTKIRMSLKD